MRPFFGIALGALGAGALAGLYATRIERARVTLSRYEVVLDAAPLPSDGLTVLHLTDFHFRNGDAVQARKIAHLLALLEGQAYDVVALTGDLIHHRAGFDVALRLVEALRPRLAAFCVPGNHDYAEYSVWGVFGHTWRAGGNRGRWRPADLGVAARKIAEFVWKVLHNKLVRLPVAFNDVPEMLRELEARGVVPLVNRAVSIEVDGAEVWFAGVDDTLEGRPDLASALAAVPDGKPLILLAHNPDIWLHPAVARADLVLSGHTHGGQVWLPLLGAAHTQGTHLRRRQPAGWFHRGRSRMFVSRGLGESIPLRFAARPQAALIRLVPGKTSCCS
ncbi:MAG: metallophosphoesterase [Anaerolineae bacterium]|nr:metallophosphoesterase [Anaerolineae bacterium]